MDFNEVFCEAVDIIVAQRLSEIKYDQTIVCTIVDISKAESGCYVVTNDQNLKFEAYSENTSYRNGEQVYVLIPQGDYSAKKQILSQYNISKNNEEEGGSGVDIVFPMDQIIPVGLLCVSDDQEFSLKANGENTEINICNYEAEDDDEVLLMNNDVLFIQALFKGNISPDVRQGNYGLEVIIKTKDGQIYSARLDSQKDMNGNIYNSSDFSPQEQVYQLALNNRSIIGLQVKFYQDGNFLDINGNSYSSDEENIFVSNIAVGYGLNVVNVEKHTVKIDTDDILIYKQGWNDKERKLNLFYFNKTASNKYIGFSDGEFNEQAKTYTSTEEENDKIYYWVEWFRDKQDGTWELVGSPETIDEKGFTRDILLDCNNLLSKSTFKAIVYRNGQAFISNEISFINKDSYVEPGPGYLYLEFELNHGQYSQNAYPSYGENNILLTPSDAYRNREIYFTYKSSLSAHLNDDVLNGCTVCWYMPSGSSMIQANESWCNENGYVKNKNNNYKINNYDCYSKTINNEAESFDINNYNKFIYQIKSLYLASAQNNIIKFRLIDTKGNIYPIAQISFLFSSQGIYGTDYTLLIKEYNNRPAYTNEDAINRENDNNTYSLSATLYDPNSLIVSNSGVILDYYPLPEITSDDDIYYNVAKAHAEIPWGTEENEQKELEVWANYPIAWSANKNYYYQGPTSIIYDSAGNNPKYYQGSLAIYNNSEDDTIDLSGITWSIVYCLKTTGTQIDEWGNKIQVSDLRKSFYPIVRKDKNNNFELKAPSVYTDDLDINICLVAKLDNQLVWIQPIIIMRDNYETSFLNDWDGSLQIQNTPGKSGSYIMASAVGAGIKHDNNTFSGVLMGDIATVTEEKPEPLKETGLFGYHQGSQAFAFKNNGEAFIGKEGCGRIEFDGNYGFIKSANWDGKVDEGEIETPGGAGMAIALSSGQIDAHNFKLTSNNIVFNSNPDEKNPYYFAIGDPEDTGEHGFIGYDKEQNLIFNPSKFELTSIGGTNLLLNSEPSLPKKITSVSAIDYSPWESVNSTFFAHLEGSKNGVFNITQSAEGQIFGITQDVYLEVNWTYTLSVYVCDHRRQEQDNNNFVFYVEQNSQRVENIKISEGDFKDSGWQFIKITFSIPKEGFDESLPFTCGFMLKDSATSFKLWHPKLESGRYATSWSKAPQDMPSQILNEIDSYDALLGQQEIFNKLTNNGIVEGIWLDNNQLYINASYIATGILASKNAQMDSNGFMRSGTIFNLDTGLLSAKNFSLQAGNNSLILKSNPEVTTEDYYLKVGNNNNYLSFDGEGNLSISINKLELTGTTGSDNLLLNSEPSIDNGQSKNNVYDPWVPSNENHNCICVLANDTDKKGVFQSYGFINAYSGIKQGQLKLESYKSYNFSTWFYLPEDMEACDPIIQLEIFREDDLDKPVITHDFNIQNYKTWQQLSHKFDIGKSDNKNFLLNLSIKVNGFNVNAKPKYVTDVIDIENEEKIIKTNADGNWQYEDTTISDWTDGTGYRFYYHVNNNIKTSNGDKFISIRLNNVFKDGDGAGVKNNYSDYEPYCKILIKQILSELGKNCSPGYFLLTDKSQRVFKIINNNDIELEDITDNAYIRFWHPKLEESLYSTAWSAAPVDLDPHFIRKNIIKEAVPLYSSNRYFKGDWVPDPPVPSVWKAHFDGELISASMTNKKDYYLSVRHPKPKLKEVDDIGNVIITTPNDESRYGIKQLVYLEPNFDYIITGEFFSQTPDQIFTIEIKYIEINGIEKSIKKTVQTNVKGNIAFLQTFTADELSLAAAGNYDLIFESDLNDSYFSEITKKHNDFTFNKISSDDKPLYGEFYDSYGLYKANSDGDIEKFTSDYYVYRKKTGYWYYLDFDNPSSTSKAFSYVGEKYKSKFGLYHLKMEKINSGESASPWEPHPTTTIEQLFNRVSENGTKQGLFIENGQVMLNADYIQTGALSIKNENNEIFKADADNGTLNININEKLILNSNPSSNNDYYFKLSSGDGSELSFDKSGKLTIKATEFSIIGAAQPNLFSETAPNREGIIYTLAKDDKGEWVDSEKTNTWFAYSAKTTLESSYSPAMFEKYNGYGFRCTYGNYTEEQIDDHSGWGMYQNIQLTPGKTYTFSAYITAQGRAEKPEGDGGGYTNGCNRQINFYIKDLDAKTSENKDVYYTVKITNNNNNNNYMSFDANSLGSEDLNWPYQLVTFTFILNTNENLKTKSKGRIRIGIYAPTTFNLTNIHNNTDSQAYGRAQGGKFWVYYPKLEEGTEATPWIEKEIQRGSLEAQFQELTQNGKIKGIYYENNDLFINADYIKTGTLSADFISGGTINAKNVTITNLKADNITGAMSTEVTIGGWNIDSEGLSKGEMYLNSNGTAKMTDLIIPSAGIIHVYSRSQLGSDGFYKYDNTNTATIDFHDDSQHYSIILSHEGITMTDGINKKTKLWLDLLN